MMVDLFFAMPILAFIALVCLGIYDAVKDDFWYKLGNAITWVFLFLAGFWFFFAVAYFASKEANAKEDAAVVLNISAEAVDALTIDLPNEAGMEPYTVWKWTQLCNKQYESNNEYQNVHPFCIILKREGYLRGDQ